MYNYKVKTVKCSLYRPSVAQSMGRVIALLFHDRGTRRWWVVNSTPRLHFTPGKNTVPIVQEAGWAPGPVWTGRKSRPHQDPNRPARSQSLCRLTYPAHTITNLQGVKSRRVIIEILRMFIKLFWISTIYSVSPYCLQVLQYVNL